jgi:hypothetical protein
VSTAGRSTTGVQASASNETRQLMKKRMPFDRTPPLRRQAKELMGGKSGILNYINSSSILTGISFLIHTGSPECLPAPRLNACLK